ncbi:MAG: sigma-70 family RNA polymerase sigma factor [Flavipsychrobacter sp.]
MKDKLLEEYPDWLFPYAYNILGSTDDAKDAVQDVLSNYISKEADTDIDNIKGYLVKSVVNQSINIKKRRSRTVSDNVRLPEPVATENADTNLHLNDIVSYAMLILLDQLTIKERAVFVLKEAFNYSHKEIAEVLNSTIDNSRKLLSRAKQKLKSAAPTELVVQEKKKSKDYLADYINAIRSRDTHKLEQLFADEIVVVADGGDKVRVVRNVTEGVAECAALLLKVYDMYQQKQTMKIAEVNHQPAILYYYKDTLTTCQVFTLDSENRIVKISSIIDADKLKNIALTLA